jgi:hypothetical protein
MYRLAGRVAEAIRLGEQVGEKQAKQQGPDHPCTLTTLNNLAAAYRDAKRFDRAAALARTVLERERRRQPLHEQRLATALAELGLTLLQGGRPGEGELPLRECLALREQKQPGHWLMFNTRSLLGGALMGQKKYREAEPLLLEGYRGLKAREKTIPPIGKVRLTEVLERLALLYQATGPEDKAAQWAKKLATAKLAQQLWQDLLAGRDARHRFAKCRHEGTLTTDKGRQVHRVDMQAGRTYVLDLESQAFYPVLVVEDPKGARLAENDDISPQNPNSRVILTAPASGSYRVIATAFQRGATGAYVLRIRRLVKPKEDGPAAGAR